MSEEYASWHSRYQVEVQWGDCDPADIVYYPNYYRWMDNASHALFSGQGFSFDALRETMGSVGFPLVETNSRYHSPSRIGDVLVIYSKIESIGRKSLKVRHHITLDGNLCVDGYEVRILGAKNPDSGKLYAMVIPDKIRDAFAD